MSVKIKLVGSSKIQRLGCNTTQLVVIKFSKEPHICVNLSGTNSTSNELCISFLSLAANFRGLHHNKKQHKLYSHSDRPQETCVPFLIVETKRVDVNTFWQPHPRRGLKEHTILLRSERILQPARLCTDTSGDRRAWCRQRAMAHRCSRGRRNTSVGGEVESSMPAKLAGFIGVSEVELQGVNGLSGFFFRSHRTPARG